MRGEAALRGDQEKGKRRNTITGEDDYEEEVQNPLPMMLDVISLAVVRVRPPGDVRKNEHIFRLLTNLDFSHKGEPSTNWEGELPSSRATRSC